MPEAGHITVGQVREDGTIRELNRAPNDYDKDLPTPNVELVYDDKAKNTQTIEAEAELFEENYRAAHARRWKGQERWMGGRNEQMRLVNILHPHDFMRKLQTAGVEASIEPAVKWVWVPDDKTGLLALKPKTLSPARLWLHEDAVYLKGTSQTHAGRIGISAWVKDPNGQPVPRCVTSLQWDCGPEWSLMYFDEFDVPIREKYRGWRTALLSLITEDVITEEEAERAFGAVTPNEASELYLATLQSYRQRKKGMA